MDYKERLVLRFLDFILQAFSSFASTSPGHLRDACYSNCFI